MKVWLLICLLATWASAEPIPNRHMVLSVLATTDSQFEMLRNAADNDIELDFWTHPRLNGYTDVMVPWERFNELREQWTSAGMEVLIKQENVEQLIYKVEEENARIRAERLITRQGTTLAHDYYRSYQQIIDDIVKLRNTFGTGLIRFDQTGASLARNVTIEGRIIHFVELGSKIDSTPVIMLEVNIHAREWITAASNMYLMDWLLTNYATNADAKFLLDNYHLVIIPVANPDGYEYSRTNSNNRLWRKNRRYVSLLCYGVDLNRNFNAYYSSSGSCSSATYPGTGAHSEPETRAVESVFRRFQSNMAIYLPVHCYSQVLLLPWSYQSTSTVVDTKHRNAGQQMVTAMRNATGLTYAAGTAFSTIGYAAAGTSGDWALVQRQSGNQKFLSIAYELRPSAGAGNNGFILPATQIVPTGQELTASLVAVARFYSTS